MRILLMAAILWGAASLFASARAQQFSAEMTMTKPSGEVDGARGNVFVSDGRVRIETPLANGGYFLVDGEAGPAYIVMPAQGIYMDAKRSSALTQIFAPVARGARCQPWPAVALSPASDVSLWQCRSIGPDIIAGRASVKYEATSPAGEHRYRWIDAKLGFPVRAQDGDGETIALSHIEEGAQPAALFEIPAGYRKFDPQQLIERIKHSDVWVEPEPH